MAFVIVARDTVKRISISRTRAGPSSRFGSTTVGKLTSMEYREKSPSEYSSSAAASSISCSSSMRIRYTRFSSLISSLDTADSATVASSSICFQSGSIRSCDGHKLISTLRSSNVADEASPKIAGAASRHELANSTKFNTAGRLRLIFTGFSFPKVAAGGTPPCRSFGDMAPESARPLLRGVVIRAIDPAESAGAPAASGLAAAAGMEWRAGEVVKSGSMKKDTMSSWRIARSVGRWNSS
mmetsp:Transcript_2472/g.7475  ORF Transcript_2472/g.7475 Transcript_2472/m.7475 type:complete len:240 (+) Transcript_2472:1637-2356(+)